MEQKAERARRQQCRCRETLTRECLRCNLACRKRHLNFAFLLRMLRKTSNARTCILSLSLSYIRSGRGLFFSPHSNVGLHDFSQIKFAPDPQRRKLQTVCKVCKTLKYVLIKAVSFKGQMNLPEGLVDNLMNNFSHWKTVLYRKLSSFTENFEQI
jgi:hypothetical protein